MFLNFLTEFFARRSISNLIPLKENHSIIENLINKHKLVVIDWSMIEL